MSYEESKRGQDQSRREQTEPAILKLLDTASDNPLDDPELRHEIINMFQVLQRIETLARRQLEKQEVTSPERSQRADVQPEVPTHREQKGELQIGRHIVAFDPAEFSHPPKAASTHGQERHEEVGPDVESAASGDEGSTSEREARTSRRADQPQRWWLNFNGNVSLVRLAQLRRVMRESPFTIEARFDEITDGLIVLRLVTKNHMSSRQMDWVVRQVMASVGIDREAAILSRD